ncbi:MAG: glycosyltransferase family 2 protein [Pseudomonadota bacterium]
MEDLAPGQGHAGDSDHGTPASDDVLRRRRQLDHAPVLSVVVPMYNEETAAPAFFDALEPVLAELALSYEIICVNDGSRDATIVELVKRSAQDNRIKVIDLSRNFGKEAALSAGLDAARGQAVVPIDADLQEPPELLPQMVDLWLQGYDVVLAKRKDRSADRVFKRNSARLFYILLRGLSDVDIPENVGDFRLMDRKVNDALRRLPERSRFMKGLFAWLGFREATVEFVRPARQGGPEKQNLRRLIALAMDGLISFSTTPLRFWGYLGFVVAMFAFCYGLYIILKTLIFGVDTPGFATLATVLLFFNGLLMINLGVLGEYVTRIYTEVKQRPLYLVRERINFEADNDAPPDR